MNNNDIMALIKARELVIANPREVLKDKKIKRYNNISRLSEETASSKVSSETCPLTGTSSPSSGLLEISSEDLTSSTERVVMLSPPASTSNRVITGISVQHSRTRKGVKVMVNLQTLHQSRTGDIITLTAELKRWDRLRELKPYELDSSEFADLYADTIEDLKRTPADQRRPYCFGRLHNRGARSEWYPNMFMLGILDEHGHLQKILFNCEGAEYEIQLDHELSPRQAVAFYSSGIWGVLRNNRPRPSLSTAPTRKL